MARLDYYLVITMVISLIWGIFILIVGAMFRFASGNFISSWVENVESAVKLSAAVNSEKQNICPVETNVANDINFGEWQVLLGSLIIVAGASIVIFSALGFAGALKRNTIILVVVILVIMACVALEYFLLQIATDESAEFHESAKNQLVEILETKYKVEGQGDMFSTTMNSIMITGECCGVFGSHDFVNLTFIDKSDGNHQHLLKVSAACCKKHLFGDGPGAFKGLLSCAAQGYDIMDNIHKKGCYTTVFNYINDGFGTAIMLTLIGVAVWEMVQLVLAVLLIFTPPSAPMKPGENGPAVHPHPHPEPVAGQAGDSGERESITEKPPPKRFVPYSKISSYQHPDISRIKSTEIW